METKNNKNRQSGFGLIQVVIAASLMSIVALGTAGIIASQSQQISYMEDRMSHLSLRAEIENFIKNNEGACDNMVDGKKLPLANKELEMPLTDKDGNVVYDPKDPDKNTIDKLVLNKIYMRDVNVASGGTGLGDVELVVEAERIRTGGGPTEMRPIVITQSVSINPTTREILSCGGAASSAGIPDCVYKLSSSENTSSSLTGGIMNKVNVGDKIAAVRFYAPATTKTTQNSSEINDDGSKNNATGSTTTDIPEVSLTFYPGLTTINGKVLPEVGTLTVVSEQNGTKKEGYRNMNGRKRWKDVPTYGKVFYYGGVKFTAADLEGSVLPPLCGLTNVDTSRMPAAITGSGIEFYTAE